MTFILRGVSFLSCVLVKGQKTHNELNQNSMPSQIMGIFFYPVLTSFTGTLINPLLTVHA